MMISGTTKQVTHFLNQAVAEHRKGQTKAAIDLYLKSLDLETSLPDWVYENIIILLSQVGRIPDALRLKTYALEIHFKSDKVNRAIGFAFNQQGDWDNSINYYLKTLEISADQPDWLYAALVEMLVEIGQVTRAIEIGHLGLKFHDSCGWLNYHFARALAVQEKWAEAIFYYTKAAQIKSDLPNVQGEINLAIESAKNPNKKLSEQKYRSLQNQALTKQQEGQIEAAITLYLESVKLEDKQPAWVYENVITLLVQVGRVEQALSLREQALRNHPLSDKVYRAIGLAFNQQGDWDNSINYYLKTLEISDKQPDWLYSSVVEMLVDINQSQQAVAVGSRGIKLYEDSPWICYHLAESYVALKEWDKALFYYNRTAQVNSELTDIQDKIDVVIQNVEKSNDKELDDKFHTLHTKAVDKHKEGKLDEAITLYLKAIKLDSKQPAWVYGNIITLFSKLNRLDEGFRLGEKALTNHPDSDETYRALGLIFNKKKYFDSSIDCYLKALEIEKNQPDWLYASLVEMYVSNNQFQQAIKLGNLGLKFHEDSAWITHHLEEAVAASGNNVGVQSNYDVSIAIKLNTQGKENLLSLLNISIKSAQEYLKLGDHFFGQGMWPEAIDFYHKVIAVDKNLVWAHYNIGRALTKQNKLEAAIDTYLQTIKVAPNFPEVYPTVGDLLFEKQRWQEAKKAYQKAIELQPNLVWSQYNLARTFLKLDEVDEAISALLKVIEIDPTFALAYPILIKLLLDQEIWSTIVDICQKSLEHNPEWQKAYLYLGKAQIKLRNFEKSIITYNLAAQILTENVDIYEGLGDAYRYKAQKNQLDTLVSGQLNKKALHYYEQALSINPNIPSIYHKILAIEPTNAHMYAQLAKVLEAKDQIEAAIQFYQIAKNICPENIVFSLQLWRAIEQRNISSSPEIRASDIINLEQLHSRLSFKWDKKPIVSIIIPVYNKIGYTLNCLNSLIQNVSYKIPLEVIVVDDSSSDETKIFLENFSGLRYIKNEQNMGFIKSCNHGASHAKGKYLCFLNNDTEVRPQWLETMLETIEKDEQVGVVGSKLVYPNGQLQEAGGVIWSDATGWNYGRMQDPEAPEYNYLREVDYCSGASLLVKKSIFDDLNGFEKEFVPAYYEDTDLCFAVRDRLGLKVVYQPKSQIIHYEGISSGVSLTSGVKKYQKINSVKFAKKWQKTLPNYCPTGETLNPLLAPRRLNGQKTILIIEHDVPFYDKESGYRRLFEMIKILKNLDCHVIYAPDKAKPEQPYTSELQNMGIEVLYKNKTYQVSIEEQIANILPIVDIAWICRPDLNQKYAWLVRKHNTKTKIIYDTIDLHYVRLKRSWELLEDSSEEKNSLEKEWQGMQTHELHMAQQADITLTVTTVEKDALLQQGIKKVEVVPNIHEPYAGERKPFVEREGILFIGGYKHVPNIDCVEWLCKSIMPIVWQTLPEVTVTLLGSHPPESVRKLASDQVTVPGYIKDVSPYFLNHRVFVSPLRFGAGMKGKIGQSLEYGLPVVSSNIGAEGMRLNDGHDVLIGDDEQSFANQIIRLYENQNLWNRLASNSQKAILPYTAKYIQNILSDLIHKI